MRGVREGCLDHLLILSERHSVRGLRDYIGFYIGARIRGWGRSVRCRSQVQLGREGSDGGMC